MAMTLYNLHTDGDQWRITKFVDGNPESSYLTTHSECQCPAGHRHTCRHRQMLPAMLAAGLENSHFFWDFDRRMAFDISGNAKHLLDALAATKPAPNLTATEVAEREAQMQMSDSPIVTHVVDQAYDILAREGLITEGNDQDTPQDTPLQPHSQEVKAGDFDSPIGGSNPPAVATPAKPWRRL